MTISRTEWGKQFNRCWICGAVDGWNGNRYTALETHELVGNSRRARALTIAPSWLRVCSDCHSQLSSSPSVEELARSLAIKAQYDPENYDLEAVNKLLSPNRRGGWSDGPVTQSDVDAMAEVIFGRNR